MKSVLHSIKNFKQWFKIKRLETGFISEIKDINMTDKHSDIETEPPPNKKLCVEESKGETNDVKRVKSRKVALLLSYMGDNYFGMQRNNEVNTIEGELISALIKAECIPPLSLEDPYKIHFQRTARTDKGVSAAKQIVSLVMAEKSCVETINKHLPEDIRVLAFKRVTKGFHCQNECTARIYSYTLPTFALAPEFHEEYPKQYRVSQETLKKTNDILLSYIGTHNFHNFTSKKFFSDPSSKRYIMNFNTGEPFIHEGEEFVTLKVKGQSFMLHQIRKMVGHMIAILKGVAPPNIEADVWTKTKFSLPMAPGLGLVLEDVLFNRYNKKFENDGIHGSLTFDELADEVESFKRKILSKIVEKEIRERVMFQWLFLLQSHTYVKEETPNEENETSESTVKSEEIEKCEMKN